MMGFFRKLVLKHPYLKRDLIIAHIDKSPEEYVKEKFFASFFLALIIFFCFLIFANSFDWPIIVPIIIFLISFYLLYKLFLLSVAVAINRRAKKIDREVIFAGRFLLVKLHAGTPLINALIDASKSYGVSNQSFKEIVHDIETGVPLEEALDHASRYNPSKNFRRIIFNISNALKIGVDMTDYLESIVDEISETQLISIKRYGKKMSGYSMFYMLFAIILPSLGITLLITIASFLNFVIGKSFFFMLLTVLIIIQFMFITIFKSSRPNVNI